MKQPRKLTRAEKILLSKRGYDPAQYWCSGADKQCVYLVDKQNGEQIAVEL